LPALIKATFLIERGLFRFYAYVERAPSPAAFDLGVDLELPIYSTHNHR